MNQVTVKEHCICSTNILTVTKEAFFTIYRLTSSFSPKYIYKYYMKVNHARSTAGSEL